MNSSHPLSRVAVSSILKEEDKPGLILKIRSDDSQAADTAILSHVRLALGIVASYMIARRKNATLYDDLVSAAIEGLCHGVNKIKTEGLPHNNLTGYLIETMHRFISEYLEHLPVVRVPARTKRERRSRGVKTKLPGITELTEKIIEEKFDCKINNTSQLELDEILDKIAQSPTEKTIISLRIEGYKDDEIADQVGLSKTTVFLIRRELESRFVTLFGV